METTEIELLTKWRLCRKIIHRINLSPSDVREILEIKLDESGSTQRGAEFRGSVKKSTFTIMPFSKFSEGNSLKGVGRIRHVDDSKVEISILVFIPFNIVFMHIFILVAMLVSLSAAFAEFPEMILLMPFTYLSVAVLFFGGYYVYRSFVKNFSVEVQTALNRWFTIL